MSNGHNLSNISENLWHPRVTESRERFHREPNVSFRCRETGKTGSGLT